MKSATLMAVCTLLGFAGGAIGAKLFGDGTGATSPPVAGAPHASSPVAAKASPDPRVTKLEARVAQLERALKAGNAERDTPPAAAETTPTPATQPAAAPDAPAPAVEPAKEVRTHRSTAQRVMGAFDDREAYGDALDVLEDADNLVRRIQTRAEKAAALDTTAARALAGALAGAKASIDELGRSMREEALTPRALRERVSGIERQFRSATASGLTEEQLDVLERVITGELSPYPGLSRLLEPMRGGVRSGRGSGGP